MAEEISYVKGIDGSYFFNVTTTGTSTVEIPSNMKFKIETIHIDGSSLTADTEVIVGDQIDIYTGSALNELIHVTAKTGDNVRVTDLKLRVIDTLYVSVTSLPVALQ